MNRLLLVPAVAALVASGAYATPASAEAGFGVAPVAVADPNTAPDGQPELLAVNVGHHATYDRVVFRFSGPTPGYNVRYVRRVTADPSGLPVRLDGDAVITVTMHSVASAQAGKPAAPQGRQRPRFPALREVAGAGDFEGHVSFGLGTSSKSGFRAFTLSNPDRLVVDVRIPARRADSAAPAAPTAPAAPEAPAVAGRHLADTGERTGLLALGGVALLMAGGAARLAARSRG